MELAAQINSAVLSLLHSFQLSSQTSSWIPCLWHPLVADMLEPESVKLIKNYRDSW